MSEDMFQSRPTVRSTVRTVLYLPKEDVSRTIRLLTSPSDSSTSREGSSKTFKPYSVTTASSSPSGFQTLPVQKTDSSALPYRFASVERLIHRQKIYDSTNLPVVAHFDDTPVEYTYSVSLLFFFLSVHGCVRAPVCTACVYFQDVGPKKKKKH